MREIKTSELIGAALDWAVARCNVDTVERRNTGRMYLVDRPWSDKSRIKWIAEYSPSKHWAQGGPIVEREIFKIFRNVGGRFTAQIKKRVPYYSPTYDADIGRDEVLSLAGDTPLIAAMRCYVASKLGDEVEIPAELMDK